MSLGVGTRSDCSAFPLPFFNPLGADFKSTRYLSQLLGTAELPFGLWGGAGTCLSAWSSGFCSYGFMLIFSYICNKDAALISIC